MLRFLTNVWTGYFVDEAEAAKAYDEYAAKERRPVNFPKGTGTEKAKKRPAAERSSNIRQKSSFKGVYWNKRKNRWRARIVVKGADGRCQEFPKGFNSFKNELDAARAYDLEAARRGLPLNFPRI